MAEIDALRAAYRQSLTVDDADHLSENQWERLACDELPARERQGALDHILECPLCSDTYRTIQVLRSEAAEFDEAVPATPGAVLESADVRRFPWRGLGLLAMAATVVLVVVLPTRLTHEPVVDDESVVLRSTGDDDSVSPISPLGEVRWKSGEDVVMKWTAGGTTPSVFVEILDGDGELVWTGPETASTTEIWPGEEVPGPGRYYWRILVRDRHAREVDSELVSFDLVSASRP